MQSTLTKQITTLITSSNRQSLAKRIISNLKTLNTNKQSVTKMLFKTMNVDGKCSIDFPYSLDPTTTFTAFLDTHTLSLRRSDGCYFPAFDIDTAVQKAVNLKLFSEKFGNGSHGLVITDLVTPNFSISSGNAGSSTLILACLELWVRIWYSDLIEFEYSNSLVVSNRTSSSIELNRISITYKISPSHTS